MLREEEKQQISEHLIEAMNREELHTRKAAEYLNLNPCYISMAKRVSSFNAMSAAAWERLADWHTSRDKISAFVIPEGEELYKPFDRKIAEKEVPEVKPEKKAEKPGKSVKLILNKAEMSAMQKDIELLRRELEVVKHTKVSHVDNKTLASMEFLRAEIEALKNTIRGLDEVITNMDRPHEKDISDIQKELWVLKDETLAVMSMEIKSLQRALEGFKVNDNKPSIVIFQRNTVKP